MGDDEFSANGIRASVADESWREPTMSDIITRIARLAQRQSRGPIPNDELEREIGAIERVLDGLPNHELTDVFGNFVRGEITVLKERNLRDAKELRDDPKARTLASMVRDSPKPGEFSGFAKHRMHTVPRLRIA